MSTESELEQWVANLKRGHDTLADAYAKAIEREADLKRLIAKQTATLRDANDTLAKYAQQIAMAENQRDRMINTVERLVRVAEHLTHNTDYED